MDSFFWIGLANVVEPVNLAAILIGVTVGMFVGAMPGLSATMAIALLLPLTYSFRPETGLALLASLYLAAMYGGSIAAILLRTPGTPAAAATVLDGYPMAQKGHAGKALGLSLTASLIGGVISAIVLLTVAPLLGRLVLNFGPVEIFAIAVLGITIIGSLSQGSTILGLMSGAIGLLLGMVGMDLTTGTPRFSFGFLELFGGIDFTVALIGLFSIPQAVRLIMQGNTNKNARVSNVTDRMLPTGPEFLKMLPNSLRSSVIGVFVGLIPGTGGDTASWFAYNEAKRFSRNKAEFGTGYPAGIVAPEAANNAVVGGALIPTIALGIPGSASTAVLLGGLMVHGILPGPSLMTDYGDVTYTLLWAVLFANVALFLVGLLFTRACVAVTKIPNRVVGPVIVVLSVIGAYAINNSVFDIGLMIAFGMLGLAFDSFRIPTPPLVIGLILGPILDTTLQQSLLIGGGQWTVFIENPISATLLVFALLSILQATPLFGSLARRFRTRPVKGAEPAGGDVAGSRE
ncbi:MAG: tripartite tricarboxylate transporter permease [Aurantimonas endophytica]|uniref:Putative tricarboxylic transport membrane protein n=1 Tax=Aurantimonas endophytica TaxID=1522175 RepID=A0A7W6MPW3_9HYPH|nr:tripartite tricarboxylate transporter permease [Aurantimonas endophytica]MBB4003450.1 putative tricarboxylic transport membrane protein [Aurantimonas endophytica]MCO6404311.1 C4-dicarboxylate ABC transporter permease [Aurantimonas endophytica]